MNDDIFDGFERPTSNFSRIPNKLFDMLPKFETHAELAVVLYILRHTWGFHEDEKKITLDEFQHGRKRRDESRIDSGTGLSKPSIVNGIKRAVLHGFIKVESDDSDAGRKERYYSLVLKDLTSEIGVDVKDSNIPSKDSLHRTEKETTERNYRKKPSRRKRRTQNSNSQFTDKTSHSDDNASNDATPENENTPKHAEYKDCLISFGLGWELDDKRVSSAMWYIPPIASWLQGKDKPESKRKDAEIIPGCVEPPSIELLKRFLCEYRERGMDMPNSVGVFSKEWYKWEMKQANKPFTPEDRSLNFED